jgi:hypothetical protein
MLAIWLWIVDGLLLLLGGLVLGLLEGQLVWATAYLGVVGSLIVLVAVAAGFVHVRRLEIRL